MKKWAVILFAFTIVLPSTTLSQSYPHITELRGLEDPVSQTHLFYRYLFPNTSCWSKSIYHFDVTNEVDTFFILDSGWPDPIYGGCEGDYVNDYEFFSNNPSRYIYCGYELWIDPVALLRRYDGEVQLEAFALTQIEISKQNDSLVYVSAGPGFFKSTDGGYNFVRYDSMQFIDESIISLSKNNDSHIYGINDSKLVRSENDGASYIIVDNSLWTKNSKLFYDSNINHIYGLSLKYNYQTQNFNSNIYMSDNNGDPFTWSEVVNHTIPLTFTNDEIISGEIYYSYKNKIFKSSDYGNSFFLYKNLNRNITGLYKKSGSNILYASTPLKIYEITPDTTIIIKNLPIPDEVLSFYPLAIGNKWIYDEVTVVQDPYPNAFFDILVKGVIGDTIAPNGKHYFQVIDETLWESFVLERVDSSDGKVYRYFEDTTLTENEYVAYDLLAEAGDTINSFRSGYNSVMFTTMIEESTFNNWGLTKLKKVFLEYRLHPPRFSLTQDLGLDSIYSFFDFGDTWITLKGCIINGVVVGDTTTVSVENEHAPVVNDFKLEQNYPNPFNPTTNIGFRIADFGFVTLKIYDVLGNEVATLVNEQLSAGEYEVEFNIVGTSRDLSLPSGIYFYRLQAGEFIQTKKMVLLK